MSPTMLACFGLAVLGLWTAPMQAQGVPADTSYSAVFQCPESLPTAKARTAAAQDFVVWAQEAHPDWTLADATAYRMDLLISHHCEATLTSVQAHAAATEAAAGGPEPAAEPAQDSGPSNGGAYLWRFVLLTGAIAVMMWWWRGRAGGRQR